MGAGAFFHCFALRGAEKAARRVLTGVAHLEAAFTESSTSIVQHHGELALRAQSLARSVFGPRSCCCLGRKRRPARGTIALVPALCLSALASTRVLARTIFTEARRSRHRAGAALDKRLQLIGMPVGLSGSERVAQAAWVEPKWLRTETTYDKYMRVAYV